MQQEVFSRPSVIEPSKPPAMGEEAATDFAGQFAVAQGDTSPEAIQRNKARLQAGEEQNMRYELSLLDEGKLMVERNSAIHSSIAAGDAEGATSLINYTPAAVHPSASLEQGVVDQTGAIHLTDQKEPKVYTDHDARLNKRMLMIINHLTKSNDTLAKKYPADYLAELMNGVWDENDIPFVQSFKKALQEYDKTKSYADSMNLGLKDAAQFAVQLGSLAIDLVAPMVVQSDYAAGKSQNSLFSSQGIAEFFMPGSTSQNVADMIMDLDVPDDRAEEAIAKAVTRYQRAFIGQVFTNPLKLASAFSEMVGSGQIDNPVFKEMVTKDTFTNEQGVEIPNPLKDVNNPWKEAEDPTSINSQVFAWLTRTIDRYITTSPTALNILDNPAWDIFTLAKVVKPLKMIRSLGGLSASAHAVKQSMASMNPSQAAMLHAIPLAHPNGFIVDPTISARVAELYRTGEQAIDNIISAPRVDMNPADIARHEALLKASEFQGRDFAWMTPRVEGPNRFMDIFLQSQSGLPFLSRRAAEIEANMKGYKDYELFENPTNNSWYIKVSRAIDESKYYKDTPINYKKRFQDTLFRTYTVWGGRVWTPNATIDEAMRHLATSGTQEVGKLMHASDELHRPLKDLSHKELSDLSDVIREGQKWSNPTPDKPWNKGKWLDEIELDSVYRSIHGRLPTQKEKLGYYTYRASSDFLYTLLNKRLYDELASGGYGHWFIPGVATTEPLLAKVSRNVAAVPEDALIRLPSGAVMRRGDIQNFNWNDPNLIALKVYGEYEQNGKKVTHIIAPRDGTTSGGLRKFVLGYTEGGTRNYAGSSFIKIPVEGRSPITIGVTITRGAAEQYAAKVGRIQDIYKTYIQAKDQLIASGLGNAVNLRSLQHQYDTLIQAEHSRWTINKIEKDISNGMFDLKEKPIVRYDREPMPYENPTSPGASNVYQNFGRLYYSERGNILPDDLDDMAELENPFGSLARQQGHAARVAGFSDFAIGMMNSWAARNQRAMEPILGGSLEDYFRHGEFAHDPKGYKYDQIARAETEREYIRRVLRQLTPAEQRMEAAKMRIAEGMSKAFSDTSWLTKGARAGNKLSKKLGYPVDMEKYIRSIQTGKVVSETEAINALRGLAFDFHLGALNRSSLWVQAAGTLVGGILHPLYGTAAVLDYPMIRAARLFGFSDHIVKQIAKMPGYGDFADVLADMRTAGISNIGYTDPMLGLASGGGVFNATLGEVRNATRFFMYEGEFFSRVAGFGIARRVALEKVAKGEFAFKSPEYYRFIQGKTNTYQLGMMGGIDAAWARFGPTSIATQMLQYPFKAMEVFLGLDRSLTPGEKFKVAAMMAVLFGGYGMPMGPEAVNKILGTAASNGIEVNEEMVKTFYLGGLDYVMRNVFKQDTALSARLGSGDMLGTLYEMFLEKNFFALATGIFGTDLEKIGNISENLAQVVATASGVSIMESQNPVYLTAEVLGSIGGLFSSVSNETKALYLREYGIQINSKASSITEHDSLTSAFLAGWGVSTGDEQLRYLAYKLGKASDKTKMEIAEAASKIQIDMNIAVKNRDWKKYAFLEKQMINVMAPIKDSKERAEIQRIVISKLYSTESSFFLKNAGVYWKNED